MSVFVVDLVRSVVVVVVVVVVAVVVVVVGSVVFVAVVVVVVVLALTWPSLCLLLLVRRSPRSVNRSPARLVDRCSPASDQKRRKRLSGGLPRRVCPLSGRL